MSDESDKSKKQSKQTDITGEFFWSLSRGRPFIIDKYKIELDFINTKHMSVRIKITNLESGKKNDGTNS